MPEKNKKLVRELNRRGVIRALVAYALVVWLAATGLVDLFPAVGFPDWSIKIFLVTMVAATPLVAFLAWRYNLTFRGVLRDPADVSVAQRDTVARSNNPTRRSTQEQNTGVGVVLATWRTTEGELCEREFQSEFIIGRDFQADVCMKDDRVSRRHLRVYPVNNVWHVKDLDSLNGSFVNGKSIDDIQVDPELDVTLDKHGPKIHLHVRVTEVTAQSASTGR